MISPVSPVESVKPKKACKHAKLTVINSDEKLYQCDKCGIFIKQ